MGYLAKNTSVGQRQSSDSRPGKLSVSKAHAVNHWAKMDWMWFLSSSSCWCSQLLHQVFLRASLQPTVEPFPVSPDEEAEAWTRCEFCQNKSHPVSASERRLEPGGASFLPTRLPPPPAWLLDFCLCVLVSESGTDPSGLLPSIPQPSLFMSTLMGLCRLAQLPSASQRATWSCVCHRMFTVHGAEPKQHPSC